MNYDDEDLSDCVSLEDEDGDALSVMGEMDAYDAMMRNAERMLRRPSILEESPCWPAPNRRYSDAPLPAPLGAMLGPMVARPPGRM